MNVSDNSRLDSLVTNHPLPTWRIFAWLIILLVGGLLVWAHFSQLDEVAIASGEVVPQGKVKVIQHLEGGIIENIMVQEGDLVDIGQPLLQLDLATSGVNREELVVRLDASLLERARLEAEAGGEEPEFPPDVAERRPKIVNAEMRTFQSRHQELDSTVAVLREQVNQKQEELNEINVRLNAVRNNLSITAERFELSKTLLADGLTPRLEHLELQAELENLEGERNSLQAAIPRIRASITEAEQRVNETRIRFRREAQEQLSATEQSISRVQELLSEATGQRLRAEIKSPIDGVVKNMRYNTIGGVVTPGDAIMEIVPTGDRLVIDAKLNPTDRGYVALGQKAVVKVSTYDFVRYGGLDGQVILVGSDSNTEEDGSSYFRVVVETQKTYLGDNEGSLPITPGMQATVDIHTGTKSVMDYLIKPVLKLRHEAFRER